MSNPIYQFLKSMEGKILSDSPSPITNWLQSRLLNIEVGKATVEYVVRKEMTNPLGTLQGGLFVTMMDDALGVAVYSLGKDKLYTTVNFAIDYLAGVVEGDTKHVTAEVMREGNTILNVRMKATNPDGKLLATATSNLVAKDVEGMKLPRFKGFETKYPGVDFH